MPPVSVTDWSLRRPVRVQAAVMISTFATLGGLAWTLPWLALCLAALAWHMRHHGCWGLCNPAACLRAGPRQWCLLDASGGVGLAEAEPLRAWRGPGWLVLRLRGMGPQGGPRRVDVTVWRASLGAQAWRQLHQKVALLAERASSAGGTP